MPLYEYKCTQCQRKYEFLEKISDKPKTHCPDCQQPTLKRQISPAGFQLKGTGWYETDFKNKKKAPDKTDQTDKSKNAKKDKPKPDKKQNKESL